MYSKMPTKPKICIFFQYGLPTITKQLLLSPLKEDFPEMSLKKGVFLKSPSKFTLVRQQLKTLILSLKIDQKQLEAEFLIAICHLNDLGAK